MHITWLSWSWAPNKTKFCRSSYTSKRCRSILYHVWLWAGRFLLGKRHVVHTLIPSRRFYTEYVLTQFIPAPVSSTMSVFVTTCGSKSKLPSRLFLRYFCWICYNNSASKFETILWLSHGSVTSHGMTSWGSFLSFPSSYHILHTSAKRVNAFTCTVSQLTIDLT